MYSSSYVQLCIVLVMFKEDELKMEQVQKRATTIIVRAYFTRED